MKIYITFPHFTSYKSVKWRLEFPPGPTRPAKPMISRSKLTLKKVTSKVFLGIKWPSLYESI